MTQVRMIVLYLVAIVAANLLVARFGPAIVVFNAAVFIGLDISGRDLLHEMWQGDKLALKMGILIAAGSLISAALNADATRIALASFVAFAVSESADAVTYQLLGERTKLVKMNGSNMVSAAVDSILFGALAFGLPLLWPVIIGQFVAKVIGGAVWSWVLTRRQPKLATL